MPEKLPNPDKINEEKERIKEEVQAFKERTEGLNPEMFGVPGEEGLEKENIPEELLLANQIEQALKENINDPNFIKKVSEKARELFKEEEGHNIHYQILQAYVYFVQSYIPHTINQTRDKLIKEGLSKLWQNIEEKIKNPLFIYDLLKKTLSDIEWGSDDRVQNIGNNVAIDAARQSLKNYNLILQSHIFDNTNWIQDIETKKRIIKLWQKITKKIKFNPKFMRNILKGAVKDMHFGRQGGGNSLYALEHYFFLLQSNIPDYIDETRYHQDEKEEFLQMWQKIEKGIPESLHHALILTKKDMNRALGSDDTQFAWQVFNRYMFFLEFGVLDYIKKIDNKELKYRLTQIWRSIEDKIDAHLINKAIKGIKGRFIETPLDVVEFFRKHYKIRHFVSYLKHLANQKLARQEHQKALHPEKEVPPRPEFPTF